MDYNWRRFWCPPTGKIIYDENGYVVDPIAEYSHTLNPSLVQLCDLVNTKCLILLGEPGIGKSTEFWKFFNFCKEETEQTDEVIVFANLHDYSSDSTLEQFIFQRPEITNWINNDHTLTLFLDSLDEGLLTIRQLANFLAMRLEKLPLERLKIRIACRTSDWPILLEQKLRSFWNDEINVSTLQLELVPLRRSDVYEAARNSEVDPEKFLKEIELKAVVSFAIKPITLSFLFAEFQKRGKLQNNKAEIYCSGCLMLCEEKNPSRITARFCGEISSHQRMIVAGRIAASLMFANRSSVWLDDGNAFLKVDFDSDVLLQDIVGGKEFADGNEFPVSERQLKESLSTGLFSSRGSDHMGFSHQTYAEYLAAWYLNTINAPFVQIKSLIIHPQDPEGRIIPQLYEVAAWLAVLRPDIFELVAEREPEVLLRGDLRSLSNEQREILIESLLQFHKNENRIQHYWGIYQKFRELSHPNISDQLCPYLVDKTCDPLAREFAVDLINACKVTDIENVLADIVLDETEERRLRINAGWAVSNTENIEIKNRLKPLLYIDSADDKDDEFKGLSLKANWPGNVDSNELFHLITPPQDEFYAGAYSSFLYTLRSEIGKVDICDALEWVIQTCKNPGTPVHEPFGFIELADAIMVEGWKKLDDQKTAECYSKAVYKKILCFQNIIERGSSTFKELGFDFDSEYINDDKKRRILIKNLLPLISNEEEISRVVYSTARLFINHDFFWFLSLVNEAKTDFEKENLAFVITVIFNSENMEQIQALYTTMRNEEVLSKALQPIFGPIEFDSQIAVNMKKRFELGTIRREDVPPKMPTNFPSTQEQIELLLEKFESGNLDSWWRLTLAVLQTKDHRYPISECEICITKTSGWLEAKDSTRDRIINASTVYLKEKQSDPESWLSKKNYYRPDASAFKALALLCQVAPEKLNCLPKDIWKRWAPIILLYPVKYGKRKDETVSEELLITAYQNASSEILSALQEYLTLNDVGSSIIERIEPIFDNQIQEVLLEILYSEGGNQEVFRAILELLIRKGDQEAIAYAEQKISSDNLDDQEDFQKALISAQILILHTNHAGWETIWPRMTENIQFGDELIKKIAFVWGERESAVFSKLLPCQLTALYIWLIEQYPPSEDPNKLNSHQFTIRDEIADFRNRIPKVLAREGSTEANNELAKLIERFPDITWLKYIKQEANVNLRINSWFPSSPREILELLLNSTIRQVQSGEQLLDLLIESLAHLEKDLQGETPAVVFLWNEWKLQNSERKTTRKFRPKEENQLSDFVKAHLLRDIRDRNIVINREVEIRPTMGSTSGEVVDIRVDAVLSNLSCNEPKTISAIIEIKGSWNREVKTAMGEQLVDRYLADNECKNGLYLMGWYQCSQWDDEDYKKNEHKFASIEDARKYLNGQANELSGNGRLVRAVVLDISLRE
jgi:hypothetical protein